jgi:hypothetical protein
VKGGAVTTPMCLGIGPLLEEADRDVQVPCRGCGLQRGMEIPAAKVRVDIWGVENYTSYCPVVSRNGGV